MDEKLEEKLMNIDSRANDIHLELEKNIIRKMQAKQLRLGADCCDNASATRENVKKCIQETEVPLRTAETLVKNEFEAFHLRLQTCMEKCQKIAQNRLDRRIGRRQVEGGLNDCVSVCADQSLSLMDGLQKRLTKRLKRYVEE